MSIKLNGNQIAGAPGLATTNKAGIVRMASDEEIKQGTSNTAFVTPKQLSSYCGGLELCDIGMALYVDETKGKRRYLNGSTMFIHECYEPFLKRLQEIIALYPNLSTTEENWQSEALLSAYGQVGKFVISESTYYGFASGESVVYTDSIEDGRVKVYTPDFVLLGEGIITSENLAYNLTYARNNNDKTMTKVRLPRVVNVQGLTDLSQAGIRIPAGIPDITASTVSNGAHTHTRGSMNITGQIDYHVWGAGCSGAFYANGKSANKAGTGNDGNCPYTRSAFSADRTWSGSTSSNGAHTHTVNLTKSSVYGNSETVQPEAIQYPYFIQVATGQETTADVKNELQLNNPYSLFDSKYSDHELNNLSWLKSEGQWNAKAVYTDAYDKLLKVYNGTETVEGLSVKLSTETYTDYDFVLNTSDETFRLPLLDGSENLVGNKPENILSKVTGSPTILVAPKNGTYFAHIDATSAGGWAFLNNDTAEFGGAFDRDPYVGAFSRVEQRARRGDQVRLEYAGGTISYFKFIPDIGNGSLYYYVGETVQNASIINIGRVQEEVSNKLDKSSIYYDEGTQTLVIEG